MTEDMRIQSKVYTGDVDSTFHGVEQAVSQLKWTMIESDREALYMSVKPPYSFWTSTLGNVARGGDRLEVSVIPIDVRRTKVRAKMDTGEILDCGRIKNRLSEFFSALDSVMMGGGTGK